MQLVETAFPVHETRCLAATTACPRTCMFMGGSQRPNERDCEELRGVGITLAPAVEAIYRDFSALTAKPIVFRLFDSRAGRGYTAGIKEFSDRFRIWFDPLKEPESRAYTLAHEFAHGILGFAPTAAHIDPTLVDQVEFENRRLASQILSIVEHPLVHRELRARGFDTDPEALSRTESAIAILNDSLSKQWASIGAAWNQKVGYCLPLEGAETLLTFASSRTDELERRMSTLLPGWANTITALIMDVMKLREQDTMGGIDATCKVATLIGREDLHRFFVNRAAFESQLSRS
ncbi:MAG: hypothetical protein GIX02_01260 [Candidatus Eremiobacteraeota bacterium]|nr:hypothetical protein [Candidatus Eremiobacteraeota bacterium]